MLPTTSLEGIGPSFRGVRIGGLDFSRLSCEDTPWFEDEEEIEYKIGQHQRNLVLLDYIRNLMKTHLSKVEQESISVYYSDVLTYREAGDMMNVNATSVFRGVQRGLVKLRRKVDSNARTYYQRKI